MRPSFNGYSRALNWLRSDRVVGLITITALLALWEIGIRADMLNEFFFPPPSKLANAFNTLRTTGFPRDVTVFTHIEATFLRILIGYGLATVSAIPLGLYIGRTRLLDRAMNPIITFARSVATISLLPLAVAWFGVGEVSRIFLITYACFWIILTNAVYAVKSVDPVLIQAAQTLGTSNQQLFWRVMLPASLPRIFTGMKIALGLAFLVIVAVEMIGTRQGLGALIMEARTFYRTEITIVGMFIMGSIGFSLAKGLDLLERLLLPWAVGLDKVER